jgi:hypothetical protein
MRIANSLLVSVLSLLVLAATSIESNAQSYASVKPVLELSLSARVRAMGNAAVGLADDDNAAMVNPAGLLTTGGLRMSSSYNGFSEGSVAGSISARYGPVGTLFTYFDFGAVPVVDAEGNLLGQRRYSSSALLLGVGAAAIRFAPVAGELCIGMNAKAYRTWGITESGDGSGASLDLAFLLWPGRSGTGSAFLSDYRLGLTLRDLVSADMVYGNGYSERFAVMPEFGFSFELLRELTFVVDVLPGTGSRVGMEWSPLREFALRGGLRSEGLWLPTFGCGVCVGPFSVDFAYSSHRYLGGEYRVSLSMDFR